MLEVYVLLALAAVGYIVNKNSGNNQGTTNNDRAYIPKSEQPSMDDVYESRFADKTLQQTKKRATRMYELSEDPKKNRVISMNYSLTKDDDESIKRKKIKTLSGEYIDEGDFVHDNMTPFFGGRIKQSIEPYANENILMNHSGTDNLYKQKKEAKAFFEACQNVGNVNGLENRNDYYAERITAPRIRNNVQPIPAIHVGPGINQGYSSEPVGGFQQFDIRDHIMPKNVDELRVANKPKVTYDGKILDGMKSRIRAEVTKMDKNRPETSYKVSPDMWFKTTGAVVKPKINPEQILKDTTRKDTTKEYTGPAFGHDQKKRLKESFVQAAKRPQLEKFQVGVPNITSLGTKDKHDFGKSSILVYDNERDVTSTRVYQGNLTSLIKSLIAPITDVIKVTKKEDMIDNPRHFGNMNVQIPEKAVIYDPNDSAKTTLKEQLIHEGTIGNLKGSEKQKVYDPNDVTRTTLKEQLLHDSDIGNLKGSQKLRVHDPDDIMRTTLKEQLLQDSEFGNLKGSEKLRVHDPDDIMRTTLKEQLIHDSEIGNLKGSVKLRVHDPNDATRTTLKEQLIHDSELGNLKGSVKLRVHDPNDVTRTTLKEQLIHDGQAGNLKGPVRLTVIDTNDVARTTIKEQMIHDTSITNLTGPIQLMVYNPDEVARTTTRETLKCEVDVTNLKGTPANQVYNEEKLATTLRETLENNDYVGNPDRFTSGLGGDGYDVTEWDVRLTQKALLSDNDYFGHAEKNLGKGYETNEFEARPTYKSLLSDNDYYGVATSGSERKPSSTTNIIENAQINPNKESILGNREPTQSGLKTYSTADDVNISYRKNECDTTSIRESPNMDRVANHIPDTCAVSITKQKQDYRDYDNERFDVTLLKSTLDNPLHINIASRI